MKEWLSIQQGIKYHRYHLRLNKRLLREMVAKIKQVLMKHLLVQLNLYSLKTNLKSI